MVLLRVPKPGQPADVVAVGLLAGDLQLRFGPTDALPATAAETATRYVIDEGLDAAAGSVHTLPLPGGVPSTVLIVGLGGGAPEELRVAAVALGRALRRLPDGKRVNVALPADGPARGRALAEGLTLGDYRFNLATGAANVSRVVNLVAELHPAALAAGCAAAEAAGWARDLGNTPASELTPARFGALAEQVLTPVGCRVRVHDEDWLRQRGFGGLLAVGGGSSSGPRLIEASYRPRGASAAPHIVLIGKGITFDTGGLNLKPADGMRMMHTDMCGGAAVLGAIRYAAVRELRIRVTALVPTAENAVSGSAMRPSDVIRHYGGRTTEIGNTDAEGRLVLADALAYAAARLRPDALVDIATLTGAMKVALGLETAGYFANDDGLVAALENASRETGEAVWRMPLDDRYAALIESPVADARNDPGSPGGITAALFLQPFVRDVPWVHLDIAGPARALADGPIFSRGATGFGVRLLGAYLESEWSANAATRTARPSARRSRPSRTR